MNTVIANLSKEFEPLYDDIRATTDKVTTALYQVKFDGRIENKKTLKKIDKVIGLCQILDNAAHELEEHLAWD